MKVEELEVGLLDKANAEIQAKLATLPAEQQQSLIDSGKVQEFTHRLIENYHNTSNPASIKLARFKNGKGKLSEKLTSADDSLEKNSDKIVNLDDQLLSKNRATEKSANEKIAYSLAKLKEKSERLKSEYAESPEGKMDAAFELVNKNSNNPDEKLIKQVIEIVGEENYSTVIDSLVATQVTKEFERITSNCYNEGDKYFDFYNKNMISLAQSKGVDTTKRSFRDGEYDSYDRDDKIATSMVIEPI